MEITFDKEYLRDLYVSGKCNDKKYRFRSDIVERYRRRIESLVDAPNVEWLYRYSALNFEALRGDKAGTYSIRVNHKYRIEFSVREEDAETVLTVCNILELSNHYK